MSVSPSKQSKEVEETGEDIQMVSITTINVTKHQKNTEKQQKNEIKTKFSQVRHRSAGSARVTAGAWLADDARGSRGRRHLFGLHSSHDLDFLRMRVSLSTGRRRSRSHRTGNYYYWCYQYSSDGNEIVPQIGLISQNRSPRSG